MRLSDSLRSAAAHGPGTFADLRRLIDPGWIDDALRVAGRATVRRRRLPANEVVWLLIGMALHRDRAIAELAESLGLVLPGGAASVAASTVPQARARIGHEPLARLFSRLADAWAHPSAGRHPWFGLSLYVVDATTLPAADTGENRAHFGRPPDGGAWPAVRLVGVTAPCSRLIASAAFGPCGTSAHELGAPLWRDLPSDSLTVAPEIFLPAFGGWPDGRDWLVRARPNPSRRVRRRLGPKDHLVDMEIGLARALTVERPGLAPQALLTSLTDPARYPAAEIEALCREFADETGPETLAEPLRSRRPDSIAQEIWGMLVAHNLVRRIEAESQIQPARNLSYESTRTLVCA